MSTEPTLTEALEAVVEQAQEIERLKNLVSTVKGAANDLRLCVAEFGDADNWCALIAGTSEEETAPVWRWRKGVPLDLARRALQHYDAALKQWDAEHPTGVERLQQ